MAVYDVIVHGSVRKDLLISADNPEEALEKAEQYYDSDFRWNIETDFLENYTEMEIFDLQEALELGEISESMEECVDLRN